MSIKCNTYAGGACLPPTTTCQEDMPCFDCTTMGNRVCGPTTTTVGASPRTIAPGTLAFTGTDVAGLACIGALLVAIGTAFVSGRRR